MARKRFRSGVWHHRVPDFKLVYCGEAQASVVEHDTRKGSKQSKPSRGLKPKAAA